MSSIRIVHGTAMVNLDALDFIYADGQSVPRYIPSDVVQAALSVLKAVDTEASRDWISALENGAASRGLTL